ncbi:DNA internalization-related competence protein ComEC/Rec2 [bacterium]|nr:MAG: DNA internalization-related competence protein ComEC/Rec2 [bacterium]
MKKSTVIWVAYPIIKALIAFVLGILLSERIHISIPLLLCINLSILIALSITHIKSTSVVLHQSLLFALLFGVGLLRADSHKSQLENTYREVSRFNLSADSLLLFGEIQSVKPSERSISLDVQADSLISQNTFRFSNSFLSRIIIYRENVSRETVFSKNSKVKIWVKLKPVPEPRNPHQFDYAAFLYSREILSQYELLHVVSVTEPEGLQSIKPLFEKSIESLFEGTNSAIAKALIIGDKSDINPEQRQAFTRSGLAHMMAVSGLHVGFLVAPFWFLIPWFWTKRSGRIVGIILLGLGLLFYAWLTGFSASVVRASIMALLFSYAKLFERVRYPMNIVGFAAFFLLMINPAYVFDVGFQLSFGAVSIILLVLPTFSSISQKQTWSSKIISALLVGIVVQVGLAPILALYFGEISIVSPISNLAATIPASLLVVSGLVVTIIGIPFPSFASYFSIPLNWLASSLQFFASFFSSSDFSYARFSEPNLFFFLFWMGFLAAIASWTHGKTRWGWFIFSLISLVFWRGDELYQSIQTKPLELTIVDVGQGDASLIETPDNRVLLIDTGIWSPNFDSGSRTILPLLKSKGINRIHALILTHPHADHIGGTLPLLETLVIDTLYSFIPDSAEQSSIFKAILKSAQEKSIPVKSLFAGDYLHLSSQLNTRILWPLKTYSSTNTNEYSTILRLDYGTTSFLFTGDAEHDAEDLLSQIGNEILDTDYLKVGHHGSKSSSSGSFLDDVTPQFASVSLAMKNKYRHPHAVSVSRLLGFTKNIHFTSLDGAAVYKSDGKTILKDDWRKESQ